MGHSDCLKAKSLPSGLEHRTERHQVYSGVMAFDRELADELLEERDRDTARFFAGRNDEIRRFDAAVRESGSSKQVVFRIYQGAPGCGKTSLVDRLRQIRAEGVLFVDVGKKHLASDDALAQRVRDAAIAAGSTGSKIAAAALRAIGSRLRMQPVGDALGNALVDKTVDKTTIVFHLDEAQLIAKSEQPTLVGLHTHGMGVPAVCLFTGLGHTEDTFLGIGGLSRLADNAVVDMGAMSNGECANSTRMMLDELSVVGDESQYNRAAQMTAALSFGWPQHLHCAQQALCRELLQTDGVLEDVRVENVREEADQRRQSYYERRLRGTVLNVRRNLTALVVERVGKERPADRIALADLCEDEIQRSGLADNPNFGATSGEFAAALVEQGVLAFAPDCRYDLAIPSMGRWFERDIANRAHAW